MIIGKPLEGSSVILDKFRRANMIVLVVKETWVLVLFPHLNNLLFTSMSHYFSLL